MNVPESLPARLYLLAYDTEKNRLTSRSQLGLVLRAAALTDLYLERTADRRGRQAEGAGGRAHRRPGARRRGPGRSPTVGRSVVPLGRGARSAAPYAPYASSSEAERCITVNRRTLLPDKVELRDRRASSSTPTVSVRRSGSPPRAPTAYRRGAGAGRAW